MHSIDFEESNIAIAKDQDEYITLPAYFDEKNGLVNACFQIDEFDHQRLLKEGKIWIQFVSDSGNIIPFKLMTASPIKWLRLSVSIIKDLIPEGQPLLVMFPAEHKGSQHYIGRKATRGQVLDRIEKYGIYRQINPDFTEFFSGEPNGEVLVPFYTEDGFALLMSGSPSDQLPEAWPEEVQQTTN